MKPIWEEIPNHNFFIYHTPGHAVYGTIYVKNGYYCWSARVMDDCRFNHKPIFGKALSLGKAKHMVEVLLSDTDTLSRNNISEENQSIELFLLMNSSGQFMRSKGFSGSGKSWVDGIKTARIYTSIGPAKAQVTYWKKHFQEYECPKIAVLEATIKEVLDQSYRVSEVIKKQKQDKINAEEKALKNKISSLTDKLNRLKKEKK
jgi:hypothetical protein